MRLILQSSGAAVAFDARQILGRGGEGTVYQVPANPDLVAKIYHPGKAPPLRKLELMLANAPSEATDHQGHSSIAWPVEILLDPHAVHLPAGFLMKRASRFHELHEVYDPGDRVKDVPAFTYQHLLRTASNLASALRAIHQGGYVAGDLNEQNVGVTETALVTLFDTDSFQVDDPARGVVFRCTVARPGFAAPELIRAGSFDSADRTTAHDHFALAVLFFKLLMEGAHPFDGVYSGAGDVPDYDARIEAGHFVYSPSKRAPYQRSPRPPAFEMLTPELQRLFIVCFDEGHRQPSARPDALAWQQALSGAEALLRTCAANSAHRYFSHVSACPWCARKLARGYDPFPSAESIRSGTHLPVAKPKPPPARPPAMPPGPSRRSTARQSAQRMQGRPVSRPPARRLIRPTTLVGARRPVTPSRPPLFGKKLTRVLVLLAFLALFGFIFGEIQDFRRMPDPRSLIVPPAPSTLRASSPGINSMAVDRTERSPFGDLRAEFRSGDYGAMHQIWLTSVTEQFAEQLLTVYRRSASVLFSPDEKWIAINSSDRDSSAIGLFHKGEQNKYDPVFDPALGLPQLDARAWSFFLQAMGRSLDSSKEGVSIAAKAWSSHSQDVTIWLESRRPAGEEVVPGFWCCKYDPNRDAFTAVSPLADFRATAEPRVEFDADHYFADEDDAAKFLEQHLAKKNRSDVIGIMQDYAADGDFSDKRTRTKQDLENDEIGQLFRWPRSREELITRITLTSVGLHRWDAVYATRYRSESDAGREAVEGKRKYRSTIAEAAGKFQITKENSFAYGEHSALAAPPPAPATARPAPPPASATVNPRAIPRSQ